MYFNGKSRNRRKVDFSGNNKKKSRQEILEESRLLREKRLKERKNQLCATKIQSTYRSYKIRRKFQLECMNNFDYMLKNEKKWNAKKFSQLICYFNFMNKLDYNKSRIDILIRMLYASCQQKNMELNYLSLVLNNNDYHRNIWTHQVSCLYKLLLPYISTSNNDKVSLPLLLLYHIIDINTWVLSISESQIIDIQIIIYKILQTQSKLLFLHCRNALLLYMNKNNIDKNIGYCRLILRILSVSITLAIKNNNEEMMIYFIIFILSIPYLKNRMIECNIYQYFSNILNSKLIITKCVNLISNNQLPNNINTIIDSLPSPSLSDDNISLKLKNRYNVLPTYSDFDEKSYNFMSTIPQIDENSLEINDFSDSDDYDSDDDDEKYMEEKKNINKRNVVPSNLISFLLGNIIELTIKELDEFSLASLVKMLDLVPSDDLQIISNNKVIVPPLYAQQMNYLMNTDTAHKLFQLIEDKSHISVMNVCLYFNFIIEKFVHTRRLQYTLIYSTPLLEKCWKMMKNELMNDVLLNQNESSISILTLFFNCYNQLLFLQTDEDFYERNIPLNINDVCQIIKFLNSFLYKCFTEPKIMNTSYILNLRTYAIRCYQLLRDRHAHRSICDNKFWQMNIIVHNLLGEQSVVSRWISEQIPFVMKFNERVSTLYKLMNSRRTGNWHDRISVIIRRDHVLEDGYDALKDISLHGELRITFKDEFGETERGVDGGGLFKEFLNLLLKEAFNPNRGLFCETPNKLLYPDPKAQRFRVQDNLQMYKFVGKMLGKAIFDGIVIEPQFAIFFLKKILGKPTYLHDLTNLDEEVYKNLMFLRGYDGDVEDLQLTFSVDEEVFGQVHRINLIPNGSNIPVTNGNKLQFMFHMADFKLNRQIRLQSAAFLDGLGTMIDLEWLKLFEADELSKFVSGSEHIDVNDFKSSVQYSNGYSGDHITIKLFWEIVEEMNEQERKDLLRFITSCPRAPLLGFKSLHPTIAIQQALNTDALPTASTCFNLLRLPDYSTKDIMRQKLLLATKHGNTGFALT